jgi:hypothetical protein
MMCRRIPVQDCCAAPARKIQAAAAGRLSNVVCCGPGNYSEPPLLLLLLSNPNGEAVGIEGNKVLKTMK